MKHWILALFGVFALSATAGEREDLLNQFKKEDTEAEKTFQEAMTTVELTSGAGNKQYTAEQQLFRAMDYKLRQTTDPEKRLKLIENFHELSKTVQEILDTPRDNMGSLAGMLIYSAAEQIMKRQTKILLLCENDEKRWTRFANATLFLKGHELDFKFGKAEYITGSESHPQHMEIYLEPENTFQFQNRFFAIIREDITFTCNDDFSSVYFCELKNNNLIPLLKCAFPYFSKWTLENNVLKIYYEKQVQTIYLAKPETQAR
jgi:hypothetical protein